MILWTIKLVGMVRKAIAGRKYPSQLAWAVAFGVLLGIVPHGNLLAVAILIVVLSLKLNHAMAMLTAVGVTFLATKLDPVSHLVGEALLSREDFSSFAVTAWEFPMMPWTDLNNTVVLGSFTIGLVALLPIFMVTYPVFRWLAPKPESEDEAEQAEASTESRRKQESAGEITYVDRGQPGVPSRRRDRDRQPTTQTQPTATASGEKIHFVEIQRTDAAHASPVARETARETGHSSNQTVETRIDVIRVNESSDPNTAQAAATNVDDAKVIDTKVTDAKAQPMDEALNYLLRQLRDSQQRNVA